MSVGSDRSKCILHIGMPKTGSSSIQEFLGTAQTSGALDSAVYAWPTQPNHSAIISNAFETAPAHRKRFHPQKPEFEPGTHQRVRAEIASLKQQAERTTSTGQRTFVPVVISGERMSLMSDEGLGSLCETLHDIFDDVASVCYVRPLSSYLASAMQQILKHGPADFDECTRPFNYKKTFSRLDRIFGAGNLTLVPYIRAHLAEGDVVQDFLSRIGISVDAETAVTTNTSMSREAASLLYAYWLANTPKGQKYTGVKSNSEIISVATGLANTERTKKFGFDKSLIAEILKRERENVVWMADRLGLSFDDMYSASEGIEGGIASEADLLAYVQHPDIRARVEAIVETGQHGDEKLSLETLNGLRAMLAAFPGQGERPIQATPIQGDLVSELETAPLKEVEKMAAIDIDHDLKVKFAQAMWKSETGRNFASGQDDAARSETMELWKADRTEMMQKAAKLIRALDTSGIAVSMTK
ncbi:MAG: hypothetical protein AAGF60_06475 [Pseudomonadota bacterium]